VNFRNKFRVSGLWIQGANDADRYVTMFKVAFANDDTFSQWTDYTDFDKVVVSDMYLVLHYISISFINATGLCRGAVLNLSSLVLRHSAALNSYERIRSILIVFFLNLFFPL